MQWGKKFGAKTLSRWEERGREKEGERVGVRNVGIIDKYCVDEEVINKHIRNNKTPRTVVYFGNTNGQ